MVQLGHLAVSDEESWCLQEEERAKREEEERQRRLEELERERQEQVGAAPPPHTHTLSQPEASLLTFSPFRSAWSWSVGRRRSIKKRSERSG